VRSGLSQDLRYLMEIDWLFSQPHMRQITQMMFSSDHMTIVLVELSSIDNSIIIIGVLLNPPVQVIAVST